MRLKKALLLCITISLSVQSVFAMDRKGKGKAKKHEQNVYPTSRSTHQSSSNGKSLTSVSHKIAMIHLLRMLIDQHEQIIRSNYHIPDGVQINQNEPSSSDHAVKPVSSGMTKKIAETFIHDAPPFIGTIVKRLKDPTWPVQDRPDRLLLYGPSGAGKSDLSEAIAIAADLPYTIIDASDLGSEYQLSTKSDLTRCINPIIHKGKPHVIIVDEMMALVEHFDEKEGKREANSPARRLWKLLDACARTNNIFFIGTVNIIDRLPEQLQTRFACSQVKIDLPKLPMRITFIKYYLPDKHRCSDEAIKLIAKRSEGSTVRVLQRIMKEARNTARDCGSDTILADSHLKQALSRLQVVRKKSYWQKYKKDLIRQIIVQSPQLLMQFFGLMGQGSGLMMQRYGLGIQYEQLGISSDQRDMQKEQLAMAKSLRSVEGILEHNIKQTKAKVVMGVCSSGGAVVGGAAGSVIGFFFGPGGIALGMKIGGSIGAVTGACLADLGYKYAGPAIASIKGWFTK